jgi:hypothetical protein
LNESVEPGAGGGDAEGGCGEERGSGVETSGDGVAGGDGGGCAVAAVRASTLTRAVAARRIEIRV